MATNIPMGGPTFKNAFCVNACFGPICATFDPNIPPHDPPGRMSISTQQWPSDITVLVSTMSHITHTLSASPGGLEHITPTNSTPHGYHTSTHGMAQHGSHLLTPTKALGFVSCPLKPSPTLGLC